MIRRLLRWLRPKKEDQAPGDPTSAESKYRALQNLRTLNAMVDQFTPEQLEAATIGCHSLHMSLKKKETDRKEGGK